MFMILEQLNIAEQIVEIAFAATMGALALGLALAFGLGGRPIAQQMLQEAYDSSRRNKDRSRADANTDSTGAQAPAASRRGDVPPQSAGHTTPTTPGAL
jgi:hypothetical protein